MAWGISRQARSQKITKLSSSDPQELNANGSWERLWSYSELVLRNYNQNSDIRAHFTVQNVDIYSRTFSNLKPSSPFSIRNQAVPGLSVNFSQLRLLSCDIRGHLWITRRKIKLSITCFVRFILGISTGFILLIVLIIFWNPFSAKSSDPPVHQTSTIPFKVCSFLEHPFLASELILRPVTFDKSFIIQFSSVWNYQILPIYSFLSTQFPNNFVYSFYQSKFINR